MATQAEVIAKAQADAQTINDNFSYLNTEVNKRALSSSIGNAALTIQKNGTGVGTFTANATSAVTVNIAVPTTVAELSDSNNYAKKTDLVTAIVPKGSSAFASLPTPSASNLGWLYNVTDSFTTTASFLEGAGKNYPAGTNVYVVNNGASYKWDVMMGFVDTSNFATKSTTLAGYGITNAYTKTEADSLFLKSHQDISGKADKATTLSGYGITNAYTKTEVDAYLNSCFSTTITALGTSS